VAAASAVVVKTVAVISARTAAKAPNTAASSSRDCGGGLPKRHVLARVAPLLLLVVLHDQDAIVVIAHLRARERVRLAQLVAIAASLLRPASSRCRRRRGRGCHVLCITVI
jgi:hypothetical protein